MWRRRCGDFELVQDGDVERFTRLKRSSEGKAVMLPGIFDGGNDDVALLALGFGRGQVGELAVPCMRWETHERRASEHVSSFTIIKGAMIDETYAMFAAWDFDRSKRENLDRLRGENFIGASSATWLRDVAKVLNRRFDPAGRDRALVQLAKNGCSLDEWKPLLLWHITRDEFLLRDFLQNWLFPTYDSGAFRVRPDELHDYLRHCRQAGRRH